jgi:phospholipid/cholesterol/gamma-HCH transport system substrate-binding protein
MALPREVKVGAFVFAGLLVIGVVIFMIGDERRLFESHVDYYAAFEDVQGLKPGSPVRMGGVDVGRVGKVAYSQDLKDNRLRVVLEIVEGEAQRVRQDSVASIGNKGLLGDKMVVITVGSLSEPPLPPESTIKSEQGRDMSEMLDKLSSIGDRVDQVMRNLETTTGTLAEKEFRDDIQSGVSSLSSILRDANEGDGYLGRFLRDPEEANRISRAVENFEKTATEARQAIAGLNRSIDRVNSGPGLAHEVLYGEDSAKTVAQFGRAADELATTLQGVREGNGLARSIIYGDDESAALMSDMNEVAKDLRAIVSGVRQGKGTIGALLVDPSVYEDLKLVLGNVERNKALRALVRYSIRQDEKAPNVEITDPGPGTGPAPPRAQISAEGTMSP